MNPPRDLAGLCSTRNALYLVSGKHRIVDGVFEKAKARDIVAREVLVAGDAEIEVVSCVEVIAEPSMAIQPRPSI